NSRPPMPGSGELPQVGSRERRDPLVIVRDFCARLGYAECKALSQGSFRGKCMVSAIGKCDEPRLGARQTHLTRRDLLALSALGLVAGAPARSFAGGQEGQLTWGVHITLAPTWFDPAETPGLITPFM